MKGISRVIPKNAQTIPRLEPTAAVVATMLVRDILKDSKEYTTDSVYYWTYSSSVSQFINSTSIRFHTLVHQRLLKIHVLSQPSQWHYVKSAINSDIGSGGLMPNRLHKANIWFYGADFLLKSTQSQPF